METMPWGVNLPVNQPTRYVFSVTIHGSAEGYGRLYGVRAFHGYVKNATGVAPPLKDSVDFIDAIRAFHAANPYGTLEVSLPVGTLKISHYAPMWYRGDAFAALYGILGCLGMLVSVKYVGER